MSFAGNRRGVILAQVAASLIVASGLVGVVAMTQSAAASPTNFALSPTSGPPDSITTASDAGGHCLAGDSVSVTVLAPTGVTLAGPVTTTADSGGNWSTPLTIPVAARTFAAVNLRANCAGNTSGYADQSFGITATITPVSGPPTSTFRVTWYCEGLATVAVTTVAATPTLVFSSAQSASGPIDLIVPVGSGIAPGTTLRVVTACASSYGGYSGYNGYNGYNGYGTGAVVFAPAFFTVTPYPSAIVGTVIGVGAAPLVGYQVRVCPTAPTPGICTFQNTDGAGHYSASIAFAGTYNITVTPPQGSPYVSATRNGVTVGDPDTVVEDFSLVLSGTITGTITAFGNPVTFGNVWACPIPAASCQLGFPSNGQYTISGLAPGQYILQTSSFFPPSTAGPVTVVAGGTTNVDITLGNVTPISGSVTGTGGVPLSGTTQVVACAAPFHLANSSGFLICPGTAGSFSATVFGTQYTIGSLGAGTWNLRAVNNLGGTSQVSAEYTLTIPAGGTLTGVDFTIGDAANVPPAVEDAAPPPASCPSCLAGDGNGDGIPDSSQPNVVSLPSAGPGAPYVSIGAPTGSILAEVVATDPSTLPAPPGNPALPLGVLSFKVRNVPVGQGVDVTIWFPTGSDGSQYFKFDAGQWLDFTSNVSFYADHVVLHLVDGGAGDADHQANGVVVDPGALAAAVPTANPDQYSLTRNGNLTVSAPGVLSNDTNATGGTAVLNTGPSHGTLTLNGNGSFTYIPAANFVGTDTFQYHVEANDGATSAIAVVTLSVLSPGAQCDVSQYPIKNGIRNMRNATLGGCYLIGADLSNADLRQTNLTGAVLAGANLAGANLAGANLSNADLRGTNLTGANLAGANLAGVTYGTTTCPDGTNSDDNASTCTGHLG